MLLTCFAMLYFCNLGRLQLLANLMSFDMCMLFASPFGYLGYLLSWAFQCLVTSDFV